MKEAPLRERGLILNIYKIMLVDCIGPPIKYWQIDCEWCQDSIFLTSCEISIKLCNDSSAKTPPPPLTHIHTYWHTTVMLLERGGIRRPEMDVQNNERWRCVFDKRKAVRRKPGFPLSSISHQVTMFLHAWLKKWKGSAPSPLGQWRASRPVVISILKWTTFYLVSCCDSALLQHMCRFDGQLTELPLIL